MNDSPETPAPDSGANDQAACDQVMEMLKQVIDPEIHYNIVDLGLIYEVSFKEGVPQVQMTLTTPGCPYGPMILHGVKEAVLALGYEDVQIELVWHPPWSPERMTDEAKLELGFDI